MHDPDTGTCRLIDRFSLKERLLARTGWYGFMAVAIYAIGKQDLLWAGGYTLVCAVGFAAMILPSLCTHCPYPSQYDTCLFLPPAWIRRLYGYRDTPMTLKGKIAAGSAALAIIAMPLIWLVEDIPMLLLYGLFLLPSILVFPIHYCKRCRNCNCPLNKTIAAVDTAGGH